LLLDGLHLEEVVPRAIEVLILIGCIVFLVLYIGVSALCLGTGSYILCGVGHRRSFALLSSIISKVMRGNLVRLSIMTYINCLMRMLYVLIGFLLVVHEVIWSQHSAHVHNIAVALASRTTFVTQRCISVVVLWIAVILIILVVILVFHAL
jgi:hypothetical protein